ncbi:MAG: CarD family transcriptional regulator [Lachnospiraceae bacterium]
MFKIGDYIVYGLQGLCKVDNITTLEMNGVDKKKQYYVLSPLQSKGSTIYTPTDSEKVKMRKALSKAEAEELLDEILNLDEIWIDNEKQREEQYKVALRSGDCRKWVSIIKTLYLRKQQRLSEGKKITATDERYLKQAETNLYSELSFALEIPEDEMEAHITKHINDMKTAG